jgi:hypothetical protein
MPTTDLEAQDQTEANRQNDMQTDENVREAEKDITPFDTDVVAGVVYYPANDPTNGMWDEDMQPTMNTGTEGDQVRYREPRGELEDVR